MEVGMASEMMLREPCDWPICQKWRAARLSIAARRSATAKILELFGGDRLCSIFTTKKHTRFLSSSPLRWHGSRRVKPITSLRQPLPQAHHRNDAVQQELWTHRQSPEFQVLDTSPEEPSMGVLHHKDCKVQLPATPTQSSPT